MINSIVIREVRKDYAESLVELHTSISLTLSMYVLVLLNELIVLLLVLRILHLL